MAPASGGPARSVPQLAMALVDCGHEVALWSPSVAGGGVSGRRSWDVSEAIADLSEDTQSSLRLFSGSFDEMLKVFGEPDIVHDHGVWLNFHRKVARTCRKRAILRVVSPRGMLEPWALNHKKWRKRLAWWLFQKRDLQMAAGLHATAAMEEENLLGLGLGAPIFVAANGVEKIHKRGTDGGSASRGNSPTMLFLSRIHPKKGLLILVDAWVQVKPEGWKMRVVGPDEGGHLAEVRRKVRLAGLDESWSFEEALEGEDKWTAMEQADLFILPSYSENFGIVVAEALAAGTPVIATTGTPWAGLELNQCGRWVEPEPEGLVAAIRELTSLSIEKRLEMGRRGQEWVSREFAWSAIAESVEQFYREILGHKQ
ncbi:MAG: glycosyltransferase [Verrucomicrobiales bacterium]|nr:glycosyltransferase [Verrucomicrobiales bacterium]